MGFKVQWLTDNFPSLQSTKPENVDVLFIDGKVSFILPRLH